MIGVYEQTCAHEGIHPDVDPDGVPFAPGSRRANVVGTPLAGGWRFCFGGLKADRKAHTTLHRFSQNYSATWLCERCMAVRPFKKAPLMFSFGNLQRMAPWSSTILTHEARVDREIYVSVTTTQGRGHMHQTHSTYIENQAYVRMEGLSHWLQVPGWHLHLCFEDLMHNALLGHAGDAIASAMQELVDTGCLPGASVEESFRQLGLEFRVWSTFMCLPVARKTPPPYIYVYMYTRIQVHLPWCTSRPGALPPADIRLVAQPVPQDAQPCQSRAHACLVVFRRRRVS